MTGVAVSMQTGMLSFATAPSGPLGLSLTPDPSDLFGTTQAPFDLLVY